MITRTGSLFIASMLLACGSGSGSGGSGGAGGASATGGPASPQPIGYTCSADAHCKSGTCEAQDSFQFCSASCAGGAACPAGATCVDSEACLPSCTSDADCAGTFDDSVSFYAGKATGGGKCIVGDGYCWPATDQ